MLVTIRRFSFAVIPLEKIVMTPTLESRDSVRENRSFAKGERIGKSLFKVLVIIFSIVCYGCNTSDIQRPRALKLLSEINEISLDSSKRLKSNNVQGAIARMDEHKRTFPDNLSQIRTDAQVVKDFFENELLINKTIEDKLRELLTLRISNEDSRCIEGRIKLEDVLTQRIRAFVGENDLLLDESVVDLTTLQTRMAPFQEEGARLNLQASRIKMEIRDVCSRSSFKIN